MRNWVFIECHTVELRSLATVKGINMDAHDRDRGVITAMQGTGRHM